MLKNNVIIEMKSVQFIDNEKTETELITKGNYTKQNDSWRISYEDSEATGFEGSVTEICVIGNKFAPIISTGEAHSDLVIEPKKKHHCHYETPYGSMDIGIYTHSIINKLNDDGGTLYMKYTIDINASYMSDNEIILNIKKV